MPCWIEKKTTEEVVPSMPGWNSLTLLPTERAENCPLKALLLYLELLIGIEDPSLVPVGGCYVVASGAV